MGIDEADRVVRSAVLGIVPDADLDEVGADEDLRDALELDSLDFLAFVETLASGTGVRLDEDDYPRLRTLRGAVELIAQRS
ncbi:acyl carrier protein [Kineosporiaceae bacterium SCSIO 59966]|nr:acyl carrier protein [Kineosporiaceae bacterium SCSIO 59966]